MNPPRAASISESESMVNGTLGGRAKSYDKVTEVEKILSSTSTSRPNSSKNNQLSFVQAALKVQSPLPCP